jgi:hypothetical protein
MPNKGLGKARLAVNWLNRRFGCVRIQVIGNLKAKTVNCSAEPYNMLSTLTDRHVSQNCP